MDNLRKAIAKVRQAIKDSKSEIKDLSWEELEILDNDRLIGELEFGDITMQTGTRAMTILARRFEERIKALEGQ